MGRVPPSPGMRRVLPPQAGEDERRPFRSSDTVPLKGGGSKGPLLIEGYAALFGVADLSGDVVAAGAFAGALRRGGVAMLLQHRTGAVAGRWTRMVEDGTGLFVRGLVEGTGAQALVRSGLDGLSIGFRPQVWGLRAGGGRDLKRIELVEVSLVAKPMQVRARFSVVAGVPGSPRRAR